MNGMFSNYWGIPAAPKLNVSDYLRMPVMSAPQQQQYPSMQQFVQAVQPKQEDFFNTTAANPLLHVAGLPLNQQQPTQPSQSEQVLLHIAGLSPTQK